MTQEALQEPSATKQLNRAKRNAKASAESDAEPNFSSTLIEFPGASRSIPEWRRQLSQRVREVQDRKAREAAEELAAAQAAGAVSCALPSGQLELVPDVDQPAMNPIVSKALERIDRARRYEPSAHYSATATAPALAPIAEPVEMQPAFDLKPKLSVVAPPMPLLAHIPDAEKENPRPERERKPVRLISDDDVALSYLETCLSVPPLEGDTRHDVPSVARRTVAGIFDLLLIAVMVAPAGAAIYYSGGDWQDLRTIELMSGIAAITMFAYLTISVALTGRTLAMRLFSLRAIDLRTGLIPTGGQAIKRAITQVISLAFFGLGLLYVLIDPDRRTVHDRISHTIVVRS